jgi:hypothetical protein
MTSDDNKTFSLTLSPTMIITVLLATISALGSGGYYGVTLYNRAMTAIEQVEAFEQYDDKELQSRIQVLEVEMKAAKERQLATSDTLVRLTESMTNAIALSREAKAVAGSASSDAAAVSREVQTRLEAVKRELESVSASLRNEMAGLKRATTNPLGR